MYDIIIIGSGTAGLSAAILCTAGMSGHNCDREEWNQRRTGAEYLGGGQLSGISGCDRL